MRKDLVRQLNAIKHEVVKPNASWVEKNRALLMSQIKNTVPEKNKISVSSRILAAAAIFMPETLVAGTFRFVSISLIVAMLAPSLYYGTVMASQEALPGDGLYDAKRYTEKIQVTVVGLIGDSQSETKLHMELAKRRAAETSKIMNDPNKIDNVASTVADLKNEITTISDKLDQEGNTKSISADVAKDIKQNTDQIKIVLQDAKNNLMIAPTTDTKALADEVRATKDLVQDVSVKAVEVLVTKHLDGDTSVSKEDVKQAIQSTADATVSDLAESKSNIAGVQTVLQTVKDEVNGLSATNTLAAAATSTKEIAEKITTAFDNTLKAAQVSDTISQYAARTATEVQQYLGSGDLSSAVGRVKDLTLATRDVENISDNTVAQTQPFLPVVQVAKNGVTTTLNDQVSSSLNFLSSTLHVSVTTTVASSTSAGEVKSTSTVSTGTKK